MKHRFLGFCLLLAVCLLSVTSRATDSKTEAVSIKGYVLDSACAFTKGLDKPISPSCARSCARKGSQLVILTDDGVIYWPISKEMPAVGQNARLMAFAGKHVSVSGNSFERGGSKALVIEKIAADTESK